MKYCITLFFLLSLKIAFSQKAEQLPLFDQEEWISLFNGKDLTGWDIKFANRELNDNYKNTFQVADTMIRVMYDAYDRFDDAYAHLYYKTPYSYYKLRYAYRFYGEQVAGGEMWNVRNSGIMVHSQSAASNDYGQFFPVSIEIQLLGGLGNRKRTTGNLCTPGTAAEFDGKVDYRHCINSNSKTYHGDRWVRGEIIVMGGQSITHIIENDTVMHYQKPQIGGGFVDPTRGDADWTAMGVENKTVWLDREGEILESGYIALQAESHPIDFKDIELLDLSGCTDPKAKNYKSYYVKPENTRCIY